MFENITQAYDKTDATGEIIIMLIVAFLLGMLVHWAFTDDEECHHTHEKEPAPKPVKKAAPRKKAAAPKRVVTRKKDDLRMIDGIGPKIEGLLNDEGIINYSDLAKANKQKLDRILEKAGPRYQMHDPATWAAQARRLIK